jgi:hypothetical protein
MKMPKPHCIASIDGDLTPVSESGCLLDQSQSRDSIRIRINVFTGDDGTGPTVSQEDVDAQMAQLDEDFRPWRIQFAYQTAYIPDGRYRSCAQ